MLSMMQLGQETLLVAVCKLTLKAVTMQALSRRGVKMLLGMWTMGEEGWGRSLRPR